ncbi:SOS response-associated peptidase [Aestuariibaculum marinum]|uniref:Abasic site processing protein n=1 Tax=Aestuariibaculum marinum TaxID=2683592 RepID=A0A8J6PQQ1_9FLAO|nr:SOS response-associated peptidase [Aestuariibaculum marinum]MBD0822667.1 SOS response-associated peptidase [Aestuariibaculum marinum]
MCYANALRKSETEILATKEYLRITSIAPDAKYHPTYHLNGFSHGNLYIIKMDDPEVVHPAAWGLVPHWASHNANEFWKKSNTLNARAESIFDKASFKDSAESKRCLILSNGFYEPHHVNKVSTPYFCYQPSKEYPEGDLFFFAGLYSELDNNKLSATIITTEANDFFAEVHNLKKRMPLVLDKNYHEDWFDDGLTNQDLNELMATGFTNNTFKAHPVSKDIYKKGIDTNKPYIIEPVEKDTLF